MPRLAAFFLSGVAAFAMTPALGGTEFYFRMVRPLPLKQAPPTALDNSGPPAAGTDNGPPGASTNDGPSASAPALRFSGYDTTSQQGLNVPIDGRFVLDNAVGSATYAVVSGSLPPQVTLAQDGAFTGTPDAPGKYSFVVRGTDSTPTSSDLSIRMDVVPEAPQITVHMPDGPIFVGSKFAAPISVDNGVEVTDFTFSETPPSFLSIVGNEMRGAPTAADAGFPSYAVQANDPYGRSGPAFGFFEVATPSLAISGLAARVRAAAPFSATVDTNVPDGAWAVTSNPGGISGSVNGTTLSATTPAATADTAYSLSVSRTRQDGIAASGTAGFVAVPPLSVSGGGAVLARVGRALASVPTPTASNLLDPAKAASWGLGTGILPSGVTVDPAAGSLTGTPAAGTQGDYPGVAAKATDPSDNTTATGAPFPVKVLGAFAFQGIADRVTLTRGAAYTASPSFANNSGAGAVTASNLPADLTLSPGSATPTLSGAPSAVGTSVSRFSVTDPADGASGVYDITFNVVDPVTSSSSTTTARKTSTVAYEPALSGQAPFTTRLASGSLPDGLTADPATLRITGSPQQVGTFTATYDVTDAQGAKGSVPITVTVSAAPTATAGSPLRFRANRTRTVPAGVTTSGIATPAWSQSGAWPAWLTIDGASGDVTGSPTSVTTAAVTALVTDQADKASATAPISVSTVDALVATAPTAVTAREQVAIPASTPAPSASNLLGTPQATWALASGTLPGGLAVDPAKGTLVGTPAAGTAANYFPALTATDPTDGTTADTAAYAVKVLGPLTYQGTASSVTLTRGRAYTASPSFLNNAGSGPVTASNLPDNLTLTQGSATPTLSGSPSTNGARVSRFAVTDPADGASGIYDVTFNVVDPVTSTSSGTTARRTSNVSYTPALSGQAPFTTRLVSGSLPANLQADPATLRITGTPTAVGTSTATYEVTDATGAVGNIPVTITVTEAPTAGAGTKMRFRASATRTLANGIATSGFATPSWATSGTWPTWLTIDATTGNLTGSPTSTYSNTLSAKVTDLADGANATTTIPVEAFAVLSAFNGGTVNVRENVQTRATVPAPTVNNVMDSARPATWALASGTLASGLSIDPVKGTIVGTPAAGTAGTTPITVAATDPTDLAKATTSSFNVVVIPPITFQGLPANVTVSRGYGYTATVSFQNSSTAAVTAIGLPTGMSLAPANNATPALVGNATANGNFASTFSVTDPRDQTTGTATVNFSVVDPLTATSPNPTFRRTSNVDYRPTLTGQAPYTVTVGGGSLPPSSITLTDPTTLRFQGVPETTGTWSYTYNLTDANGQKGKFIWAGTISSSPTAATNPTQVKFRVGRTMSRPNGIVTTGITTASWSSFNSTYPSWLTIDPSTGNLVGTPTVTSNSVSLGAKVTDTVDGAYATAGFAVGAVGGDFTCTIASKTYMLNKANDNMSAVPSCDNAMNVPTFTVSPALPAGLNLRYNGQLYSAPGTAVEWTGTITGIDAGDGSTSPMANITYSAR